MACRSSPYSCITNALSVGFALVSGLWALAYGAARVQASPSLVLLAPRDRPAVTRSLREAVGAQLSDLRIRLRVHWVDALPTGSGCDLAGARRLAARRDVAAVFWFQPGSGRVCLVLSPDRGGRLVTRRLAGSGKEGRYDAAAVLIRTALRGSQPSAGAPGKGAPAGPRGLWRPPSPSSPGAARLELELAYALSLVGPGAQPLGHGLRLAAQARVHRRWSVYLGYRLEARLPVNGDDGDVELQRYPVDAGVRFQWWLGALELGARLGVGFAYTRLFERLPSTSSNAAMASSDWLVFLDAHLHLGFRPVARLLIFVAVGGRAYLLNATYSRASGETLLSPWPVQPSFLAGLSIDVF